MRTCTLPDTMTSSQRRTVVWVTAVASLLLYAWMHRALPGLLSAEPSYAGEVFPFVKLVTQQSLLSTQQAGGVELHKASAIRFGLAIAALFALYAVALRAVAGQDDRRLTLVVGGAGAALLVFQLTSPVTLSTDVFGYAYHGRIAGVYDGNPYDRASFVDRPDDPYLQLLYGKQERTLYGPVALLTSTGIALLGGERVGLTVLLFRLAAVLAALGTATLVWSCLRRTDPSRATQGLVFFLWNPLVVLETGLSAHNDLLMVLFLALGVWLHLRERRVPAVLAFGMAALVKFVAVVLIPLYLLLVVRQLGSWRERCRFLAVSGLFLALVLFATVGPSRVAPAGTMVFGNRYINNVHEPVFRALRRWAGESEESLRVPVWFRSWWVNARDAVELRAAPSAVSPAIETVAPDGLLVVLNMPENGWLWVYRHETGQRGYVLETAVRKSAPPPVALTDPELRRLMAGPWGNTKLRRANAWLRGITWFAFVIFWLGAAWRTRDLRSFLVCSTAVLLASYWLVGTWIWPWYIIWALTMAAFVPASAPAVLAALLSATVLTLYISIGAPDPLFTWRSIPAFVLPLVLFVLVALLKLLAKPQHGD